MGLFSVKIQKKFLAINQFFLSMKRSPDNQINASFTDISRIKRLVFLLRSSFFRTNRPLASSKATAYLSTHIYRPDRTDGIPERRQRQWISIRLYKFLAGTSKEQVVDKGIRQLIHWRQCLLSWANEPCPLGFRETLACIHVIPHNVTATCGVLTRVLTASDANWFKERLQSQNVLVPFGPNGIASLGYFTSLHTLVIRKHSLDEAGQFTALCVDKVLSSMFRNDELGSTPW